MEMRSVRLPHSSSSGRFALNKFSTMIRGRSPGIAQQRCWNLLDSATCVAHNASTADLHANYLDVRLLSPQDASKCPTQASGGNRCESLRWACEPLMTFAICAVSGLKI